MSIRDRINALRLSNAGTERGAARQYGWNGALDEVVKLLEAEPDVLGLLRLNAEVQRLQTARIGDSETIGRYMSRVEALEKGIREHRDARGDDRCWLDDVTLYQLLPEGFTPEKVDSFVELERCKQFIACRQNPATQYMSPQRRIDALLEIVRGFAAHPVECDVARDLPCSCGLSEKLAAAGAELEPEAC